MRMLVEDYEGRVPRTISELVRLPGVARKTANVVASELGEAQGIVVDTHVRRLAQRLALTREQDPVKIERDLIKLVPRESWRLFPHLLIWHGRRVCDARRRPASAAWWRIFVPRVGPDRTRRPIPGEKATSSPPSSS